MFAGPFGERVCGATRERLDCGGNDLWAIDEARPGVECCCGDAGELVFDVFAGQLLPAQVSPDCLADGFDLLCLCDGLGAGEGVALAGVPGFGERADRDLGDVALVDQRACCLAVYPALARSDCSLRTSFVLIVHGRLTSSPIRSNPTRPALMLRRQASAGSQAIRS